MPNLLAIDTSSTNCTVAVLVADVLTSRTLSTPRHSAQQVLPLIAEVMEEADTKLSQLDAIAVLSGPGSFTGIRIGIGVAQGLSMAHNTPVLALSSLAVKAMAAMRLTGHSHVLVSDAARETEVYFGSYRHSVAMGVELIGAEQVGLPTEIELPKNERATVESWLTAGTGWTALEQLQKTLGVKLLLPVLVPEFDSRDLCELARLRFLQGEAVSAEHALPNYVKESMHYSR